MIALWQKGSMQRKLVLQLAAIAAILSLTLFLIVRGVAERAASETQDNILAASATSISDALYSERGEIQLELPYSALSMLGTISEDRVFYRVIVGEDTLTGYEDLPFSGFNNDGEDVLFSTFPYKDEIVRSVAIQRIVSNQNQLQKVTIVVAQTRLGLEAISSRITTMATTVGFAFFIVATALSLLAAHSAMAPINRIAGAVSRRGPQDLRPVTGPTPVEMLPLVDALNNFMSRLKLSLLRSEDLIAEAAHRVRTPLATVRTQAEVVHRSLIRSRNKSALREMIRAIDESSRTAGQILDHAMVNFRSDQFDPEEIDLAALLEETAERLSPTAELRDINIELEKPDGDAPFFGDAILLQSAFRNILDNGIKYSPTESQIIIRLERNSGYQISFIDQGRGFQGADVSKFTQRFSRGSNVEDIIGSGLGLTIVDEVAKVHNGRLEIKPNEEGVGSCVKLYLPLS